MFFCGWKWDDWTCLTKVDHWQIAIQREEKTKILKHYMTELLLEMP